MAVRTCRSHPITLFSLLNMLRCLKFMLLVRSVRSGEGEAVLVVTSDAGQRLGMSDLGVKRDAW